MAGERAIVFSCEGDRLVGILHEGAPNATRGVLVVVGGPQYRVGSHRQFVLLARDLAARGIPVFRFDYRGMGDSDGLFRGFEHVGPDIGAAVAAFHEACPGVREVVLWGLCDGATAAAFFAGEQRAAIAGLVLVNPRVRTEQGIAKSYVRNYYGRRLFEGSFWRKLLSGGMNPLRTLRGFLTDVGKARDCSAGGDPAGLPDRFRRALVRFDRNVLVILSGRDLTAGEFEACFRQVEWKSLVSRSTLSLEKIPGADHTFSARVHHAQVGDLTATWIDGLPKLD